MGKTLENIMIKPGNGVFYICWLLCILSLVLIWVIFKNKSEKVKKTFITVLCSVLVVVFFVYKIFLSMDKQFLTTYDPPLERFNWFNELPLQLCNINMFLIPIGVLLNKRSILGFAFFLAPLGATMALFFPEAGFVGYPVFMPRVIGFYLTHFLIVIAGISLAILDFYRPKLKDFPGIFATLSILALVIHGVNYIFRVTGLCTISNYFFTFDDVGISILALFHRFIKIPFLYLLPSFLILGVYMGIVSLGFFIGDLCRKKRKKSTLNVVTKEKVLVTK